MTGLTGRSEEWTVDDLSRCDSDLTMVAKGAALESDIGGQIENRVAGPSPQFPCRAWFMTPLGLDLFLLYCIVLCTGKTG